MITLRFVSSKTPIGLLIQGYTWSKWEHVEFVLPDGFLGAHLIGGVQLRKGPIEGVRSGYAVIDTTPEVEEKAIWYARQQLDKPYDLTAIAGIVLHRDWRNPNRWICPELILASLEYAGDPILNVEHINRIEPWHIAMSPRVRFIPAPATIR